MLDSKQEEIVQHHCERILDRISALDADRRPRLLRALKMAHQLIAENFAERIDRVVVDYHSYSAEGRLSRLPLLVHTRVDRDEHYAFEKELADKVLGPVLGETRVSMPVELLVSHDEDAHAASSVGLLYAKAG